MPSTRSGGESTDFDLQGGVPAFVSMDRSEHRKRQQQQPSERHGAPPKPTAQGASASPLFKDRHESPLRYERSLLWPRYKSAALNLDFYRYVGERIAHFDPIRSIIFMGFLSAINLSKLIIFLLNIDRGHDPALSLAAAICGIGLITSLLYLLSFLTTRPVLRGASDTMSSVFAFRLHHLCLALSLSAVGNAVHLFARSIAGPCDAHDLFYACLSSEGGAPSLHLVTVMLSPLVAYLLCGGLIHFAFVLALWTIITILVCIAARFIRDSLFAAGLLGISLIIAYVVLTCASHLLDSYEHSLILTSALEQNANSKLSHSDRQLSLWRSTLVHMANGLKTPLQSFAAGSFSLRDVTSTASAKGNCSKSVATDLTDICDELDACSALLSMQINRALDVCEARSPGGRLKACYESVNFDACLVWALNVMGSLQSKVSIRVLPYPFELSPGTHIITDKMWLMENFLCLLSNAVKYSLEDSTVTVKISIRNYSSVRSFHHNDEDSISDDTRGVDASKDASPPLSFARSAVYLSNRTSAWSDERIIDHDDAAAVVDRDDEERGPYATPAAIRNFHESSRPKLLVIEVEDGGLGIPDEKRSLLFRPFLQSESQRRSGGGTGMGLYSIALRVAELGGKFGMRSGRSSAKGSPGSSSSGSSSLTTDSTAGANASIDGGFLDENRTLQPRGSVFYFAIPFVEDANLRTDTSPAAPARRKAAQNSNASISTSGSSRSTSGDNLASASSGSISSASRKRQRRLEQDRIRYDLGESPHVLLVDDTASSLKLVARALQQEGIQVHTAVDGVTALKLMQEGVYTLVILDIQMPIMDGIECAQQLRLWESKAGCPTNKVQHILGASASPSIATEAASSGMDDFVMKPFDLTLVREKIWSHHRRHQILDETERVKQQKMEPPPVHYFTPSVLMNHNTATVVSDGATQSGGGGGGASVCSTISSSSKSADKHKKRKRAPNSSGASVQTITPVAVATSSVASTTPSPSPSPSQSPMTKARSEDCGLLDRTAEMAIVIPPSPRASPMLNSSSSTPGVGSKSTRASPSVIAPVDLVAIEGATSLESF